MKYLCGILCLCVIFSTACRRKRESAPAAPEASSPPVAGQAESPAVRPAPGTSSAAQAAPVPESIPAQHFSTLSQALLTFRRDKQRAPRDWQELISTGYLKQMPAAPPGKRYTFDRSLNVQMLPAQ